MNEKTILMDCGISLMGIPEVMEADLEKIRAAGLSPIIITVLCD